MDNVFTVEDALKGFSKTSLNHQLRAHTPESIARYAKLKIGMRDQPGRVDRFDPNLPSRTVIESGEHGGKRSYLYPYLTRTA